MIKSRMGVLRLSLALLLLAPVVEAPSALAGGKKAYKPPACGTAGQITDRGSGWTSIKMPEFPPPLVDGVRYNFAEQGGPLWPHPGDPDVLFVDDGDVLMRSTDGGCTWKTVFETPLIPTPDYPFSRVNAKIASVAMSPQPSARGYVYMAVNTKIPLVGGPDYPTLRIYRSRDLGDSWERWDQGLPEGLEITVYPGIRVAPSDPDTVYLSAAMMYNLNITMFYGRTASSAAWEQRRWSYSDGASCVDLYRSFCTDYARQFLIDPRDPQVLWAHEVSTANRVNPLMRSRDGGVTWDHPLGLDMTIDRIDILPTSAGPSSILVQPDPWRISYVLRSKNGGETFEPVHINPQNLEPTHNYPVYFGGTASQFVLIERTRQHIDQGRSVVQRYNSRARKWTVLGTLDGGKVVHYPNGQTHVFGTRPPPGGAGPSSIERYSGRL